MHREGGMPLQADVLVEQDVPVRLRDGVIIRADIYRPVDNGEYPAIMGWSPYGKRGGFLTNDVFGHPTRMDVPVALEDGLNKFEAPTPAYWVKGIDNGWDATPRVRLYVFDPGNRDVVNRSEVDSPLPRRDGRERKRNSQQCSPKWVFRNLL